GQLIAREGIPAQTIVHKVYQARGQAAAPVIAAYEGHRAIAPECGHWPVNVAENFSNMPAPNFGCAQQANLAAMVANPRDLAVPRASTPADTMRRMTVYDAYRKGVSSATERTSQETGTASEVGQ